MAETDLKSIANPEEKIEAIREIAKTRRLTREERKAMTAAKLALKAKAQKAASAETGAPAGSGTVQGPTPEIKKEEIEVPPPKIEEDRIVQKLKKKFPQAIREAYYALEKREELTFVLTKESIIPLAQFLKSQLDFDYLADLCGIHYPDRQETFEVVYHLYSLNNNQRIRLKVPLKEGESLSTVSKVWKTANWHEREAYDLFGINFQGHPDLRRILLPRNWEGHPFRKEYPLEGKGEEDIMRYTDFYD